MLKKFYKWCGNPKTEIWLGVISFAESSVFLIPADALFVFMVAARPQKAWRYTILATITSVSGGIVGWMLGAYLYEQLAKPMLIFFGELDSFENFAVNQGFSTYLLLITSGLTHIPPIKIMTLVSGAMRIPLMTFIALATVTRGARFLLLGWLIRIYGPQIATHLKHNLTFIPIVTALVVVCILAYFIAIT